MTVPTQAQIEAAAKVLAADTGLSELVRVPLRKLAEAALTAAAQVGEPTNDLLIRAAKHIEALLPFARTKRSQSGDIAGIVENAENWLRLPIVINAHIEKQEQHRATAAAQVGEQTKCDYPNCPQWYGGCGPQCRKQASAQVGEQGKVVNPATVEKLDAIVPTQAQIEAVALALYNNAGAPTETLAKAAISAAAQVWEPFTSEGYRALPQYDPETIERCAQVAKQYKEKAWGLCDEGEGRIAADIEADIRKLKDEP